MNNINNKYIIDGLTINRTKGGYQVFTIPTQHFNISSLDELTDEKFEQEIQRQKQYQKDSSEMVRLWVEENDNE